MSILRLTILGVLILLGVIFGAYWSFPLYQKEFKRVEINKSLLIAEMAVSVQARRLGLANRVSIAPNFGMLFVFDRSDYHGLWMKGMRFPVDMVWVRKGRVVDLEEGVMPSPATKPDRNLPVYRPDAPADMVLEIKAGLVSRHNIKIGDEVKISSFPASGGFAAGELAGGVGEKLDQPVAVEGLTEPIENLRKRSGRRADFKIEKELGRSKNYQKFIVSYKSGGFEKKGMMSIPLGSLPPSGFPVLILSPDWPDLNSEKMQDFFASRGYAVILPDYQKPDSSDPDVFSLSSAENIIDLLDALKNLSADLSRKLDINKIGIWGQGVGGLIVWRVAFLHPEIKAYVLFAPWSADMGDNLFLLPEAEKTLGEKNYRQIFPFAYFGDLSAPVQLHHGVLDDEVPLGFSEKMFAELGGRGKKVEFFKYAGEGHNFNKSWQTAAERALQFFDYYVAERK